ATREALRNPEVPKLISCVLPARTGRRFRQNQERFHHLKSYFNHKKVAFCVQFVTELRIFGVLLGLSIRIFIFPAI
ncbi:MAG TPA: hypothetical protein VNH18_19110, partial [Bryobacteraceae bacterium]|nr:hypothetical protein [Bryobacteraceae bacterium]